MPSTRLVDKLAPVSPRPVQMQVLVLGMSRTGTLSMKTALNKLGYHSYHMEQCLMNWKKHHLQYWLEALRAKYQGKGKPYGKDEFDKVLAEYSAITDIPCIMFVDELIAAYPEAKVILTNRDVNTWLQSMNNTFYAVLGWPSMNLLALLDPPLIGPYWHLLHIIMSHWTAGDWTNRANLRQGYLDHYAHVRKIVPAHRLLEFHAGDGWAPLCEFLDKPVPADGGPYPHVNEGDGVVKLHAMLYWYRVVTALSKIGGSLLAGAVGVGAVWWWWWYYAEGRG